VQDRPEAIAPTTNLVAKPFTGDHEKTVAWFTAKHPLLGDVSPRAMIRLGRYDRLRQFVLHAMTQQV
jgi:hypothetical protein